MYLVTVHSSTTTATDNTNLPFSAQAYCQSDMMLAKPHVACSKLSLNHKHEGRHGGGFLPRFGHHSTKHGHAPALVHPVMSSDDNSHTGPLTLLQAGNVNSALTFRSRRLSHSGADDPTSSSGMDSSDACDCEHSRPHATFDDIAPTKLRRDSGHLTRSTVRANGKAIPRFSDAATSSAAFDRSLLTADVMDSVRTCRRTRGRRLSHAELELGPLTDLDDAKLFTIRIVSNWGDSSALRLGSMSFLDIERRPVPAMCIRSIPVMQECHVESLNCDKLVKDKGEALTMPWPPVEGGEETLLLLFYINPTLSPRYVRLWNAGESGESGVKEVVVSEGKEEVCRGVVPVDFGLDIALDNDNADSPEMANAYDVLHDLFPDADRRHKPGDMWGWYPIKKVEEVRIELLKNWGHNEKVALNGISIYDLRDNELGLGSGRGIESIVVEPYGIPMRSELLLRKNKMTVIAKDQWVMPVDWARPPVIVIKLSQPMYLSHLTIYNFNAADLDKTMGVQRARVRLDGSFMWAGQLVKGDARLDNIEDISTCIYFVDVPDTGAVKKD